MNKSNNMYLLVQLIMIICIIHASTKMIGKNWKRRGRKKNSFPSIHSCRSSLSSRHVWSSVSDDVMYVQVHPAKLSHDRLEHLATLTGWQLKNGSRDRTVYKSPGWDILCRDTLDVSVSVISTETRDSDNPTFAFLTCYLFAVFD